MERVATGVACLDETYLVLLGGVAATTGPPGVLSFLLLDPFGPVIVGLLGVCCEGTGTEVSASCSSVVIAAMMSSRCFASAGVRMTLAATASNSASIGSASSFEAGGVITFSLPFLEMTGIGGSSAGSSSSSWMMCFFLDLEEVLTGGSSGSFSGSSFASVGELSVADLASSSSGWSDLPSVSVSSSAC